MAVDLQAADAVLKEDYKGPVVDTLNNANLWLSQLERNTEDVRGRRWLAPLHVGRNPGVGARREGQRLPPPGNQQYVEHMGPVRYNYVRIQLTGPVIEAMTKDRGSFIRALRPEMEGAVDDGKRDMCRQSWGTSDGVIAGAGVTAGSTTVVVAPSTRDDQMRHLAEGFRIDIGTPGTWTNIAEEREVLDLDFDARTIVISGGAVTTNATHVITRSGAGGVSDGSGRPNDGQAELTGLQTIVSDSLPLHALDPASTRKWRAQVYRNPGGPGTNRAISEQLVNRAIMRGEMESGKVVEILVGSDGVYTAYSNVLTSLKRFMDTVELKGGYAGVTVGVQQMGRGGKKSYVLTWDRDCPNHRLYGLRHSDVTMYEQVDWDWIDPNGNGGVLRQDGDTDVYSASLRAYKEQVARRRDTHFVIEDIAEL